MRMAFCVAVCRPLTQLELRQVDACHGFRQQAGSQALGREQAFPACPCGLLLFPLKDVDPV